MTLLRKIRRARAKVDLFHWERSCATGGATRIAGVDEAGRGPLAGPVAAAAVVFPAAWYALGVPRPLRGLTDSKQLTETQREHFFGVIVALPDVDYAVAMVDAEEIDRINILQASLRAMNQALRQLRSAPDHVLVDGDRKSSTEWPQTPVVKGDALSYSIAAASVLAKVSRDRLMRAYDTAYPHYGFAEHKGYGTPRHVAALAGHGPCPIHRRTFSPVRAVNLELF